MNLNEANKSHKCYLKRQNWGQAEKARDKGFHLLKYSCFLKSSCYCNVYKFLYSTMLFLLRWHQQSLKRTSVNLSTKFNKMMLFSTENDVLVRYSDASCGCWSLARASGTTSLGIKGWKVMWKLRPREMSWFQTCILLTPSALVWVSGESWFQGSGPCLIRALKLVLWCRSFRRLKAEVFLTPAYDDNNLIQRKRALIIFVVINCRMYI